MSLSYSIKVLSFYENIAENEGMAMESRFRTRIEIVGAVVGIIGAIVGIVVVFHPFKPDAKLEAIDFAVLREGSTVRAKIKLRNVGGRVAFLKRAELIFDESKVTEEEGRFAADVQPVIYDWLIGYKDVENKISLFPISRRVDPDDVDAIEFVLGWERLRSQLSGTVKLRLFYNKDQVLATSPFHIAINNSAGAVPVFNIPDNPGKLLAALQERHAAYTIRQIIEELGRREYKPASSNILRYLGAADPEVRTAAAVYFTRVRASQAVSELVKALNDSDAHVRESAFNAVVFHGREAFSEVNKLMKSTDPATREIAVVLLGYINTPESEGLLLEALKDRGVSKKIFGMELLVAASATRSLAKLRSTGLAPRIVDLLKDPNLSVKLAAIDAAQELQISNATRTLVGMLESPEQEIRGRAHETLVRLIGKDYGTSRASWERKLR